MNINEYMKENREVINGLSGAGFTKRIEMNSGFSVSIQASSFHHCSPRKLVSPELYESFELGFPSKIEPLISAYSEEDETCETVFGRVPRAIVEALILKHGGIKGAAKND